MKLTAIVSAIVAIMVVCYRVQAADAPALCTDACVNGLNQSLAYLPSGHCGSPVLANLPDSNPDSEALFIEPGMKVQVWSLDGPSSLDWEASEDELTPSDVMFAGALARAAKTHVEDHEATASLLGSLKLKAARPGDSKRPCLPHQWREALDEYEAEHDRPLSGTAGEAAISAWGDAAHPVRASIPVVVRGETRFVPPWTTPASFEAHGLKVKRVERRPGYVAAVVGAEANNTRCSDYQVRHGRAVTVAGAPAPCGNRFGHHGDRVVLNFQTPRRGLLNVEAKLKPELLLAPGDVVVFDE